MYKWNIMNKLKIVIFSLTLIFSLNIQSKEIPVKDFFKKSNFSSVTISPSGKYLATKVEIETTSGVIVTERKTNKITHTHFFGEDSYVGEYYWLNDERIGFSLLKKNAAFARPWLMGQFEVINADGTQKKMIIGSENVQRTSKVMVNDVGRTGFTFVDLLRDDKDHILVALYTKVYPTLYKINIYTGRKDKVATNPARYGTFVLDSNKEFRLAIGENNKNQKTVFYRDNLNDEWESHGVYGYGSGEIIPYAFSKDGTFLYAYCDVETPITGLCKYFPKTRKTELIYRHNKVDSYGKIYRNDLLYIVTADGKPKRKWIDKSHILVKKLRALEKVFPNHMVSIESATWDHSELIIDVWSDTDTGGLYSFKTKNNELTDMGLARRDWLDPLAMAPMEPITYTARDGLEINGYLTRPLGYKESWPENLPLVLLVHGGPHGVRDRWRFDPEVQHLANRGFAVLQVNYRGSGGYGREFLTSGFNHWGDLMQDDLTDAVNWAVDQGIADKERLCIYGASYGGYAAMMSAAREPELYKCAVGYVGVYDVDSFTTVGNIPGNRSGAAYLSEVIPSDPAIRKAFSPSEQASKIKAAVFLIHGKKDEQAHFQNYEILTKKFDKIGKPYKSLVKSDEEHGFYKTKNKIEVANELEAFFNKHIGKR